MTVTQQPRRWRTAIAAALMLVASVVTVGMSPAAASAREPYPVPYFLFVQDEFTNPGGSAAGSNDWSCKPTAEHPNPVVLVHGTAGNRLNNWTTFAPLLANEGYCVFAPTFGNYADQPYPISAIGGMLRAEDSAAQIGAFVDEVLAATGAERVDILGVSQGSVVPNYFVKYLGGAAKVDKYISLGPAWNGSALTGPDGGATLLALGTDDARGVLPFCQACVQFLPASQFIAKLHEGGLYAPEVTYTNIMTRYDEGIWPYTSGYVEGPNATNIVVQDGCSQDYSDHIALLASRVTAGHVLNALDPDHPRPVPCVFVAPFVGG
ncbi:lipase [Prescottella equi]|uniref:esterase/lipase family protein n=1 Tax=Rhodococcus hoagii TaxID=43767 RepID=UPI000A108DE0|nr:alpha/beta fold hydrolase [Prescottella equi]NKS20610.1 alpha/beta fold hydrolase [Prescottella equi]ORL31427.1 lipase [Prescottella equi]ORL88444.1 lipase [Prescottella equi]ORM16261.1 lipase [Prescottella equi]